MELTDLKTGIFGYSKKDVCQYITEQNDLFSAKLKAAKFSASQEAEKLESEIASLNAKNDALGDENKVLSDKVSSLEQEIAQLKAAYAELEAEKVTMSRDYEALEAETAELREKSDVISTAIINAEKCATNMINDAGARAKDMIDEAEGKVADEVKRLELAKNYIIEVRDTVETTLKKIDAELGGIQNDIDDKKDDIYSEDRKASIKEKFGMLEKNIFKRA